MAYSAKGIILPEVYKDLAQPGVRKVGEALGDTIGFVLSPTKLLNLGTGGIEHFVKRNMDSIQKKFATIPDDKVVNGPP